MNGHLYFIGIVGHAMRGIALAARDMGYEVTGLDETAAEGLGTEWLAEHDLSWHREFAPAQLDGVTSVILTGAHVSDIHPAVIEAKKRGIKLQSYAEFVGEHTKGERVIAVSGTHGKTTTTALITWLLESAGHNPDFLIGIRPFNFDTSVRLAGSKVAVVEGDEYKASNLETKSKVEYYHPDVLVLTSVEHDHPDLFPDLGSVVKRYKQIVAKVPKSGRLIAWGESKTVVEVAKAAPCDITAYGLETGDYTARDIAYVPGGLEFDIENGAGIIGRISVPLYGRHNVLNTLAAVAVAVEEGIQLKAIIAGAATFKGAYRRFNVLTELESEITVIDDYAHHPTEVAASLEATKLHFPGRRIVAVFRPHTYSRTAALLTEYQQSFGSADIAYVAEIEGAREADAKHEVSGQDITNELKIPAFYLPDRSELVQEIQNGSKPGDVVVCMTVSGFDNLAEELAEKLVK